MKFSSYIELAATFSMAVGIVAALAPSGFEKYVKLACSLSVLLTLLLPVTELVKSIPNPINYEEKVINAQAEEYIIAESDLIGRRAEEYLKEEIHTLIKEKTGVSDFCSDCIFSFTSGGILDGVSVAVKSGGITAYTVLEMKKEILEKYLSGLMCCEVKISIE